MINYEKVLYDLVAPIVDDPKSVSVKQMESLNENEVLLFIFQQLLCIFFNYYY